MRDTILIPYKEAIQLPGDSAADSVHHEPVIVKGIVLTDPHPEADVAPKVSHSTDMSWVMLGMFAIFALLCLRASHNTKFVKSLLQDLVSLKDRRNLFDDTVRESSFLVLMTVMCAMTTAILLYELGLLFGGISPRLAPPKGMLMCLIATGLYCIVMPLVYRGMGAVFSNAHDTRLWLRGFTASQGMLGLILFPLALAEIFYPAAGYALIPLSIVIFVAIKILFICKGFRIFFTNSSSWMIFFYYLCSLEIVPLILTYLGALELCRLAA